MSLLLVLLLSLAPPELPEVELQRPGDAVAWVLEWQAPAECPLASELVAQTQAYLPGLDAPAAELTQARLRVRARAETMAHDGAWTLSLELSGELGGSERTLEGSSCEELARAVALITAVTLKPVLVARELAAAQASVATKPERAADEEVEGRAQRDPSELGGELGSDAQPDASSSSSAPARVSGALDLANSTSWLRPFQIGLRLTGAGGYGPTGSTYGSLGGALALFAGRWRVSVQGGAWLPRRLEREAALAQLWGWWLGARACITPRQRRFSFPLCVGAEGGQVVARGLAPTLNPRRAAQPWVAASASPSVIWRVHEHLGLVADASLLVPLIAASFEVGGLGFASYAPIGLRAGLGLELSF